MKRHDYKPVISIIVPVYNSEKYLEKCLQSVINQTFQDFELLLVNDGSTDNSQSIIDKFTENYNEKVKSYKKINGGQSSARNLALNYISGEYVTFLDSDDYIDSDYLEVLYSTAKSNHSDVVLSGQRKVDEDGNVRMIIKYDVEKYPNCILRRLNFSGKIYRVDYLKKHNMKFAEGKIYEDNPFNLVSIFLAKNLKILSYVGYNQVGHYGSTTSKKINENKLPFKAIEESIKYIISNKDEINDYEVFEYTLLSFFTYFIFQANKRHMYLNVDDRQSDIEVIKKVCVFTEELLNSFLPGYWNNKFIRLFRYHELQFSQRAGVFVYSKLAHWGILKKFVVLYYRLF